MHILTSLLVKLFIKRPNDVSDPAVRRAYGTMTSIVGIAVNVILFAMKFAAGIIFGAVSVSADAFNNLSDAGSSAISLVSFRISAKPADRQHPFGHARIEYIASMIVSFVILIIGVDLFKGSVKKIFSPSEPESGYLLICILALSIAAKCCLGLFYRRIGKKIDSSVMMASSVDSFSDVLSTGAVLVSAVIWKIFGLNTDAYAGVFVSVLILISGIKILNESKNLILGEAPSKETVDTIKSVAYSHPEVLGIHDLLVHSYGSGSTIASFHAEVDGEKNIFETHEVIDNIEKELFSKHRIACTIHMDPIVTDDRAVEELKGKILPLIREVDERLDMHDFRYVSGKTHINLIFDIEAPFELKLTDDEIIHLCVDKIRGADERYHAVINVDRV